MTASSLDPHGQPVTRRLNMARNADRDANELIGLARGVLADGALNQGEAEFLLHWLAERPESLTIWPFSVLFERLSEALEDGHLDSNEEAELIGLLLDFTGGGSISRTATPKTEDATASLQSSALPLCDPPPPIEFKDRSFVVTGTFVSGTRNEVKAEITMRGGTVLGAPSKKTDYLVIGQNVSDQWAHSNYGRKIEKAVALREAGNPIAIVSEKHWASHLGD